MPNVLVSLNSQSIITPKTVANGPRMPPTLVSTKNSNELPPHLLRNWIITAFCKWITPKYPFASQKCTFQHTVLCKCLNGVLRTRRRVNAVSSYFQRRKIFLISSDQQYHDFLYHKITSILFLKCYEVRTSADMHFRLFCNFLPLPLLLQRLRCLIPSPPFPHEA